MKPTPISLGLYLQTKDGNEYQKWYSNIRMGIRIIFEYSGGLIKKEYASV